MFNLNYCPSPRHDDPPVNTIPPAVRHEKSSSHLVKHSTLGAMGVPMLSVSKKTEIYHTVSIFSVGVIKPVFTF